ncbi:hydroxymethylglutaryl-CoA lyase [Nocardia sp. NBC_00416]|uniref:hydroxymethylglutaryl-CoA lyase n=1 Tax=Nocardia sp. NBC_00416 TaxID=2975991 RepID=UPI002E1F1719
MPVFAPVLPARVSIREVGPRDGLQIEEPIALGHKLELIEAIAATGVRRVEATSFVSPRAVPALADAADVAAVLGRWPEIRWSALVASVRGAQRALAAGVRHLEYVISASDLHSRANVGRGTADSSGLVAEIAHLVHAADGSLEVIVGTAWDCPFAGPTPEERVVAVTAAAIRHGADAICLGDTIGTTTPRRVWELVDAVRRASPDIDVGAHFHNTRGTGIANALAAVQAGVTSLDASVGGLGGCPFAPGASGNIATEELVYLLDGCGVVTDVDPDRVLAAAAVAERVIGHPLPSSLYRAGGAAVPLDPARPVDSTHKEM